MLRGNCNYNGNKTDIQPNRQAKPNWVQNNMTDKNRLGGGATKKLLPSKDSNEWRNIPFYFFLKSTALTPLPVCAGMDPTVSIRSAENCQKCFRSNTGNKVATKLKACLDRNGLRYKNIGNADHAQSNGKIAESALDHVYSNGQDEKTVIIPNSSSDHNPVLTKINLNMEKCCYIRKISKRSFKNYTIDNWSDSLREQPWSQITSENDIEKKTDLLAKFMNAALDEVAPVKTFTVKSNYKFGISNETKEIMKKRDSTRAKIPKVSTNEKLILLAKYKKLRNLVNARIRKESVEFNNKRIEKANSEKEVWNVINEVNKPQKK